MDVRGLSCKLENFPDVLADGLHIFMVVFAVFNLFCPTSKVAVMFNEWELSLNFAELSFGPFLVRQFISGAFRLFPVLNGLDLVSYGT